MSSANARNSAIDVARGLAVVLMIQTHLYDGWVAPRYRDGASFALTRWLGVFPLPTFLLLAGVGLAMRLWTAERRGERTSDVRRDLLRRSVRVVAAGFVVSAVLGIIDGARAPETFLRIDVLHAIGTSMAVATLLVLASDALPDGRTIRRVGAALFVGAAALVIPGTELGRAGSGLARVVLAPFVEVPGITRMPVVPLVGWLGLGMLFAEAWLRRTRPARSNAWLALVAGLVAFASLVAMRTLHARLGGTLDRTHPAIVPNLVDLGARAVGLLAATLAVADRLPRRLHDALVTLGRHSLLAYAVHLPFAYGRIVSHVARRCDMPTSTVGLLCVVVGTFAVVAAYDRFERRDVDGAR